jgi:PRTRC genetic system protein E
MFAALAEIALHTPLTLTVTREADRLHVIIAGKGDKPTAFATPVRVTGTPADLDEQLPARLVEYAVQMRLQSPATAIALPAPDSGAPARTKAASTKRTTVKAPAKKPATKKPAAPKTPPAARTGREKQQPRRAEKALTPGKDPAPSTLPGKPECLADLAALQAKHGAKLTRRRFIKEAATGRRYEKLWKNFEAFVAESAPAATTADLFTGPATTTHVALDSTAPWPFPVSTTNAATPAGADEVLPPEASEATTTAAVAAPDKPRVVGPTAGTRIVSTTEESHDTDRNAD